MSVSGNGCGACNHKGRTADPVLGRIPCGHCQDPTGTSTASLLESVRRAQARLLLAKGHHEAMVEARDEDANWAVLDREEAYEALEAARVAALRHLLGEHYELLCGPLPGGEAL